MPLSFVNWSGPCFIVGKTTCFPPIQLNGGPSMSDY